MEKLLRIGLILNNPDAKKEAAERVQRCAPITVMQQSIYNQVKREVIIYAKEGDAT